MRLYVERLNGVRNAATASGPQREFTPDFARFQRIAHLLQVAQDLELMAIAPEERPVPVGGLVPVASVTTGSAVDAAKNGFEYLGYWYYIDDHDQPTKTTFALMQMTSRLDFGLQEPTGAPFLTLPVGR